MTATGLGLQLPPLGPPIEPHALDDSRQTIVDVERKLVSTRCGLCGGSAMPDWPSIGPGEIALTRRGEP
jgi:hypothetical protein